MSISFCTQTPHLVAMDREIISCVDTDVPLASEVETCLPVSYPVKGDGMSKRGRTDSGETEKHREDDDKEDKVVSLMLQELLNSPHRRFFNNKCDVQTHPQPESISHLSSILPSHLKEGGAWEKENATDDSKGEYFHNAMGSILVMSQCFGLLPVQGVFGSRTSDLRFQFHSARTVYTFCLLFVLILTEGISIAHMCNSMRGSAEGFMSSFGAATAGAVFYGNSCIATVLFLILAPRWPHLMQCWYRMERTISRRPLPYLPLRLRVITASVMSLALCEHLMSMLANIPEVIVPDKVRDKPCSGDEEWPAKEVSLTVADVLKIYCCRSHGFIFSIVSYNLFLGILVFVTSKLATFTWNFTDVFVMLVSVGLSQQLKQLNARLLCTTGKMVKEEEWRELREHYALMSKLIKDVDTAVSGIVFLSFFNNLYFICLQLLNGLSPSNCISLVHSVYFFASFAFLIGRTVAVTLFASGIHDQGQVGLPVLFNCPSSSYCTEVLRLQTQLSTDTLALTGLNFFAITRNFMLAVAGAIVTYEVVLLQFNIAMLTNSNSTVTQ